MQQLPQVIKELFSHPTVSKQLPRKEIALELPILPE
jgi:hypothetical protein